MSSMPSTLHPATILGPQAHALAHLQQTPAQEFERFAAELLGQNQSIAAAATAEIGQRDLPSQQRHNDASQPSRPQAISTQLQNTTQ